MINLFVINASQIHVFGIKSNRVHDQLMHSTCTSCSRSAPFEPLVASLFLAALNSPAIPTLYVWHPLPCCCILRYFWMSLVLLRPTHEGLRKETFLSSQKRKAITRDPQKRLSGHIWRAVALSCELTSIIDSSKISTTTIWMLRVHIPLH